MMCTGCLYQSFSLTSLWMMGSRVFWEDLKGGDISKAGLKLPGCHCGLRFTDVSLYVQSSPKVYFYINTCHFMPQLLNHLQLWVLIPLDFLLVPAKSRVRWKRIQILSSGCVVLVSKRDKFVPSTNDGIPKNSFPKSSFSISSAIKA